MKKKKNEGNSARDVFEQRVGVRVCLGDVKKGAEEAREFHSKRETKQQDRKKRTGESQKQL
jgi:hypothetical protein